MSKNEFIELLKKYVVAKATGNVSNYLESLPGRNPDSEILEISGWFSSLTEDEKNNVIKFSDDVAKECLFGICAVLDGVRTIDNETEFFEVSQVSYEGKKRPLSGNVDYHDLC